MRGTEETPKSVIKDNIRRLYYSKWRNFILRRRMVFEFALLLRPGNESTKRALKKEETVE